MKNAFLHTLTLLLIAFSGNAQTHGKLSGTVINSANKAGIESASVSIGLASGKVLDGVLTDTKGNFTLKNVAPGSYVVKVEFVGFKLLAVNYTMPASGAANMGQL